MESVNIKYIAPLDHIRAYAAVLIVLYHGCQLIWYQLVYNIPFSFEFWLSHRITTDNPLKSLIIEGHTAVALFMVLSGFILTMGAYKKKVSYKRFIINRLLRTYPLFLLLLLAGIFTFPDNFTVLGFVQTVFAMANTKGALSVGSFSAMFWAVAVEWQFYVVFPLLIVILNRSGTNRLFGLVLVFLIMRIFSYLQGDNIENLVYWTIIGRMDQFLIGICLSVFYQNRYHEKYKKYAPYLFIISIVLVLFSLQWYHQNGGLPGGGKWKIIWPTVEGAVWAFFIICYLSVSSYIPVFISKVLANIGKISYSIYLIHFLIIQVAVKHNLFFQFPGTSTGIDAFLNTMLFIIPVTIAVSFITYTFVEKPFLDMRIKYTNTG